MSRSWKAPNNSLPGCRGYQIPKYGFSKPARKFKYAREPQPKTVTATALLEATDGTGYFWASYHKIGRSWKFIDSDPALSFLKFCGQQDASRAMKKRGLRYRWSVRESSANQKRQSETTTSVSKRRLKRPNRTSKAQPPLDTARLLQTQQRPGLTSQVCPAPGQRESAPLNIVL